MDGKIKEWVVQGWYSEECRWEDVFTSENQEEARKVFHDYIFNETGYKHRFFPRMVTNEKAL